jgi:Tol biopolymer transport system component
MRERKIWHHGPQALAVPGRVHISIVPGGPDHAAPVRGLLALLSPRMRSLALTSAISATAIAIAFTATACGGSSPGPRLESGVIVATQALTIARVNSDGSDLRRLTPLDSKSEDTPVWSPDGRKIAYVSDWPTEGIFVMDADGRNRRELDAVSDLSTGGLAWSPDGRSLAYGTSISGMWVIDLKTRKQVALSTRGDRNPSYSPDGRQITFQHNDDGNGSDAIWVMNANGTHRRQITQPPTKVRVGTGDTLSVWDRNPAWSPRGDLIAFERGYDTWVHNLKTGSEHLVATFASAPTWSPSGQTLLLSVFRKPIKNSGLYVVDPTGGPLTKIISGETWALSESSWTRSAR